MRSRVDKTKEWTEEVERWIQSFVRKRINGLKKFGVKRSFDQRFMIINWTSQNSNSDFEKTRKEKGATKRQ